MAAVATESSTPFTFAETPLPPVAPTATSADAGERDRRRDPEARDRRSSPNAKAISAAKIGVAPRMSATVERS